MPTTTSSCLSRALIDFSISSKVIALIAARLNYEDIQELPNMVAVAAFVLSGGPMVLVGARQDPGSVMGHHDAVTTTCVALWRSTTM